MNNRTREAVRTIGYLLETNGTYKAWARNKLGHPVTSVDSSACKFCLDGAVNIVAMKMFRSYPQELNETVADLLGVGPYDTIRTWDEATENQRNTMVEILKNA